MASCPPAYRTAPRRPAGDAAPASPSASPQPPPRPKGPKGKADRGARCALMLSKCLTRRVTWRHRGRAVRGGSNGTIRPRTPPPLADNETTDATSALLSGGGPGLGAWRRQPGGLCGGPRVWNGPRAQPRALRLRQHYPGMNDAWRRDACPRNAQGPGRGGEGEGARPTPDYGGGPGHGMALGVPQPPQRLQRRRLERRRVQRHSSV